MEGIKYTDLFQGGNLLLDTPQLSKERLRETMVKPKDIQAIIDSNVCKDIEFELKQLIYKLEE